MVTVMPSAAALPGPQVASSSEQPASAASASAFASASVLERDRETGVDDRGIAERIMLDVVLDREVALYLGQSFLEPERGPSHDELHRELMAVELEQLGIAGEVRL